MNKLTKPMALIMVLMMILSGCTLFSTVINEDHTIQKSYLLSSETDERSITGAEGEIWIVSFDILTEEGKISMSLEKDGDASFYTGSNIPTTTFQVMLVEPGEYLLKIKTESHSGSFAVDWHK